MTGRPMIFTWDGEVMRPQHPRIADQEYVVGEVYRLAPYEERSGASHNHYFAALTEAWQNLPEDLMEQYPTAEVLRKKMLIKAGYRDERSIVCASKAEANRIAVFIIPIDPYAVVIVRGNVVQYLTAKSQSMRAMGKADFEASKQAVLDAVAELIGVGRQTLEDNAGMSA